MAARLATYLVVAIVAGTLIAGLIVGAQRADESGPVDLIIHNARVYAADDLGSIADAIAIRGNKILKVGGNREVMRIRRPQTTVIDAKGAAVLPGFDDAHVSLIAGGFARDGVDLFGAATVEELQERIATWAEAHPDAAWITGSGWSYDAFSDLPLRAQLDAAVSDRPVQLLSQDGHARWLNSKALAAARITRRTHDPKHGVILRDRRGEPTGLVKGAAMALAENALPRPTREERAKALLVAIRAAQQHGITSVQDVGAAPGDLDLYDAARADGTLGLRVYAAVPASRTTPDDLDAIVKRYPDDPLLKTGLATLTLDGSIESQTAAMLEPYAAKDDDGELRMPASELSALVTMLDARGWQIAVDAAGDRAVRLTLDAYGAVAKNARTERAPRHRIEGVTAVDGEDMPRFGSLGIIATILPLHATGGGAMNWSRILGPERAPFGWPARSLSAAGAHLAFGTDSPRLPLDPLAGLRAAVTRPGIQAPEQLTLKSAINAWTSGAAWASFDEHRKGTLKPDMLADIVILSTDIFGGPAKLAGANVVMTIFDGKIVYRRPS